MAWARAWACRSASPASSHWRRRRAISPLGRLALTRYLHEFVRVAISRHWSAESCARAASPWAIGDRLGIATLPGQLSRPPVQVEPTAQVPQLDVKPSQAIEEPVSLDFITHLFGEHDSLVQDSQGGVVVPLAGQSDPIPEETTEERNNLFTVPSDRWTSAILNSKARLIKLRRVVSLTPSAPH